MSNSRIDELLKLKNDFSKKSTPNAENASNLTPEAIQKRKQYLKEWRQERVPDPRDPSKTISKGELDALKIKEKTFIDTNTGKEQSFKEYEKNNKELTKKIKKTNGYLEKLAAKEGMRFEKGIKQVSASYDKSYDPSNVIKFYHDKHSANLSAQKPPVQEPPRNKADSEIVASFLQYRQTEKKEDAERVKATMSITSLVVEEPSTTEEHSNQLQRK